MRSFRSGAASRISVGLLLLNLVQPAFADYVPNPAAAESNGRSDGYPDGSREGNDRGRSEGEREGDQIGYNEGFAQCAAEQKQRNYDNGYRDGYPSGQSQGSSEGSNQGRIDGQNRGDSDGYSAGSRQADSDADAAATPPGRAKGIAEANASDASAKGTVNGTAFGDKQAKQKALDEDYPRGRKTYYDERYAAPVDSNDQFSQRPAPRALEDLLQGEGSNDHRALLAIQPERASSPDYRYSYPRNNYTDPTERSAYDNGYRSGYDSGFYGSYDSNYSWGYNSGYSNGKSRGCSYANSQSYYADYNNGKNAGYNDGYRQAYQPAYDSAYRPAYNSAYSPAYQRGYSATYDNAYAEHFEEARAEAYRERYSELYNAAYEVARKAKFDAVYPIYAQQEYERGRADEAKDFEERPVRLVSAEAVPTLQSGLFEPGDVVRFKVALRNFAASEIAGTDVKVSVKILNAASAVVSEPEAVLVQSLKRNSSTVVTDALEFRLNESAVQSGSQLVVSITYKGKPGGEQKLALKATWMAGISLAEKPTLQEGLESSIRVKVKNQSKVPTDDAFSISLASKPELLDVRTPKVKVGVLQPGAEGIFEFKVIARASGDSAKIPLGITADFKGRKVGSFQDNEELPIANDYQIKLTSPIDALRATGPVRVNYSIKNVNSRVSLKGLSLKVNVLGSNASNFTVIGPNPQFLSPIPKGESKAFVVPILSKKANGGGIVELEVKEEGRTVVIHRVAF